MLELGQFVMDFARALELADGKRPIAVNQRSKVPFQAGIGPHTEAAAVTLVAEELRRLNPEHYSQYSVGVPYPNTRMKCDLCLGVSPDWTWVIEVKLLRFVGDNGQPNDNMLMHLLSPYPSHRSALTDCKKLLESGLSGRKAILIYAFDHPDWPLSPAIEAFESLARSTVTLSERLQQRFAGLVHPVHSSGEVCAWEIR